MVLAKKTVLLNLHCIYSLISALSSVINLENQDNRVTDINKNTFGNLGGKKLSALLAMSGGKNFNSNIKHLFLN